jgi:hypothetical protein
MPIWLRTSECRERVCHELVFDDLEHYGSGYSFPSNKRGKVSLLGWLRLRPIARKKLTYCRTHPEKFRRRVDRLEWTEFIPAAIECDGCGTKVVLENVCVKACPHCGKEYNDCDQLLALRPQWGRETGELDAF